MNGAFCLSLGLIIIHTTLLFNRVDGQFNNGNEINNNLIVPTNGGYRDQCLYPAQCDTNAKLLCINGYCSCSTGYEIYDVVREQCAIRQGERCSPPKFLFGENNPCVSNAYCSEPRRVCECESHAFPDVNGNCVRKKLYNDSCVTSMECDDLSYLSCLDGVCGCKLSTFDEYHQICRRKVGDDCGRTKDCIQNSECIQSKCVCKDGYSENSAKACGLSYLQSCGTLEKEKEMGGCSDIYFACVNGECRCKNPSYEIYDNYTGTCLSLVGGLCHLFLSSHTNQPLTLKNCVQNAECIRRDLSPLSQCECKKPFVETLAGLCKLPYKAICAQIGQNVQDCAEPLVCKNMRCECQNENDIYDPNMKACRRAVGSICSSFNNECTVNSVCVESHCKCIQGFHPTFTGECNPIIASTPKPLLNLFDTVPFSNSININGFDSQLHQPQFLTYRK